MYCAKCGARIADGALKCDRCGTPARIRPSSAPEQLRDSAFDYAPRDLNEMNSFEEKNKEGARKEDGVKDPVYFEKPGENVDVQSIIRIAHREEPAYSGPDSENEEDRQDEALEKRDSERGVSAGFARPVGGILRRFTEKYRELEESREEKRMARHMERAARHYEMLGEEATPILRQTPTGKAGASRKSDVVPDTSEKNTETVSGKENGSTRDIEAQVAREREEKVRAQHAKQLRRSTGESKKTPGISDWQASEDAAKRDALAKQEQRVREAGAVRKAAEESVSAEESLAAAESKTAYVPESHADQAKQSRKEEERRAAAEEAAAEKAAAESKAAAEREALAIQEQQAREEAERIAAAEKAAEESKAAAEREALAKREQQAREEAERRAAAEKAAEESKAAAEREALAKQEQQAREEAERRAAAEKAAAEKAAEEKAAEESKAAAEREALAKQEQQAREEAERIAAAEKAAAEKTAAEKAAEESKAAAEREARAKQEQQAREEAERIAAAENRAAIERQAMEARRAIAERDASASRKENERVNSAFTERVLSDEEKRLQEARRIRRYYEEEPDQLDLFLGKFGLSKEAGVKIATLFLVAILSVIYVAGRGKTSQTDGSPRAGEGMTGEQFSVSPGSGYTGEDSFFDDRDLPTGGGDFQNPQSESGTEAQQEGPDTQEPTGGETE